MTAKNGTEPRGGRAGRWLRGALTAVAIVLITAAISEIGFRVFHAVHPVFFFSDRSYNRFRGKPGAPNYEGVLNAHGFNDVDYDAAKAPGTYRVLGIGDSFVFAAVPYRYAFLTVLEDDLRSEGRPVEIINMGIPGSSPPGYLALLANEGVELDPDLVLACVFVGNDLAESLQRSTNRRTLYLVDLFRFLFKIVPAYEGRVIHGPTAYDDRAPSFTDERYLEIEVRRSDVFLVDRERTEREAAAAVTALAAMKRLAGSAGARFAVVLLPDEMQVDPELQRRVVAASGRPASAFDFSRPDRLLQQLLDARGIPVLDLLGPFIKRGREQRLYRVNDSHWNIAGNALAASIIGDAMRANAAALGLPGGTGSSSAGGTESPPQR